MIRFRHRGSFKNTDHFLAGLKKLDYEAILRRYAMDGVSALKINTPKDSGETANAWGYEILKRTNGYSITWTNSHIQDGVPIVILLQYGHGTRSGTFVEGRDFINPAMRPIFDNIAENLWKEVSSL